MHEKVDALRKKVEEILLDNEYSYLYESHSVLQPRRKIKKKLKSLSKMMNKNIKVPWEMFGQCKNI